MELTIETTTNESVAAGWRGLVRLGAAAAVIVVVMIPLQAAVFILTPPPRTVEAFFALFQDNPLLGLLDLDLLLTFDYLVMIPFYLTLYVVIRRTSPAWGLLALVIGLFSVVLFVVSREATFSMLMLSDQYAAATSVTDEAAIRASGTTLLTLYNGGTFGISYILGAISTLLFSAAMLRHHIFGRLPGLVGILTGATMLVPANAGVVGLTIAMVSLLPTIVWLILLIPHLLRVAREAPTGALRGPATATEPET
ncbi:DUF4386 family protein [Agromyces sp. NPDC055520]